jgi:hypothetical protein
MEMMVGPFASVPTIIVMANEAFGAATSM